jgi:two-component system alkaline phosphatase synthesis response regulator PhoP
MRKTLLLVEDNIDLLELLVRSLSGRYNLVTAMDGVEALRLADSSLLALVVLDLMLPELDGFQVCETLRKSPKTATVPILIMTGLPGEFPRLAGLDCGGTQFMTKPFQMESLVDKVRQMVGAIKS